MKTTSRPPGKPVVLCDSVHHRLNLYALAASAAGVSLLALAQPSEAKIIYTKTHQVIGNNGIYGLDLNHDGTVDFLIREQGRTPFSSYKSLSAKEAYGNAVQGSRGAAAALRRGAPIGPRQRFITGASYFGEVMVRDGCSVEGSCFSIGQWVNVNNRYLGLKFQIGGKIHYGWARLSVEVQQDHKITGTLTGYAYETIENKGIRAGQTVSEAAAAAAEPNLTKSAGHGPAITAAGPASDAVQPASLGQLALGARSGSFQRKP